MLQNDFSRITEQEMFMRLFPELHHEITRGIGQGVQEVVTCACYFVVRDGQ